MKKIFSIIIFALIYSGVYSQMPMLGDRAPKFKATTTNGELNFPDDYYGKWKILFSHPAAFTPVCTTELLELAFLQDEFEKRNTELVILSTDGLNSHLQWIESMESINYKNKGKVDIKFPFVSDVGLEISKMYGMIHPNSSKTKDIRAVFIINPEDKISAILYYPNEIGRNIDEIMRTLDALQKVYKKDILTPANWNEGDNILLASPKSQEEARKLATKNNASLKSYAWYLWFEKQ
jgi:peroxiredoxin (alkyl hydroperoxide reductase subunit C)